MEAEYVRDLGMLFFVLAYTPRNCPHQPESPQVYVTLLVGAGLMLGGAKKGKKKKKATSEGAGCEPSHQN